MTAPERPANSQRRADERPSSTPRSNEPDRRPDAARTDAVQGEPTPTRFVDPYDTRGEPEEPGYGHGV